RVVGSGQVAVVNVAVRRKAGMPPKRTGPKLGCGVEILSLAVNDDGREAAVVHGPPYNAPCALPIPDHPPPGDLTRSRAICGIWIGWRLAQRLDQRRRQCWRRSLGQTDIG